MIIHDAQIKVLKQNMWGEWEKEWETTDICLDDAEIEKLVDRYFEIKKKKQILDE